MDFANVDLLIGSRDPRAPIEQLLESGIAEIEIRAWL
jgi:hypothetical protein